MRALRSHIHTRQNDGHSERARRGSGIAALAAWLSGGLLLLGAALPAQAQDEVRNVRLSRNATFDRIVFDLTSTQIEAFQAAEGDELIVKMTAPTPDVRGPIRDQLKKIDVSLDDSGDGGTLVAIDLRGRSSRVFRLSGPERIVLDIGKNGQGPIDIPGDATKLDKLPRDLVDTRGGDSVAFVPDEPVAAPEPIRDPEPTPPPRVRDPEPTPPPRVRDPEPEVSREPERSRPNPLELMDPERTPEPSLRDAEQAEDPGDVAVGGLDEGPGTDPDAADPLPSGEPDSEGGWVLVRAIEIAGLDNDDDVPPTQDDLLNLVLPVSPERGGYVAARKDKPVRRLPLRALTGDDRNGRRLSGSLLQLIVEEIAAVYSREERIGTKVEIRPADYLQLKNPSSDGKLVITVIEASRQAAETSAAR